MSKASKRRGDAPEPGAPVPPVELVTNGSKAARNEKGQLLKGSNLNPKGRPKSSRHKLSESFIVAMAKDFAEHGDSAIRKVREEEPAQYLRVVASIVPKTFDLGEDDDDGSAVVGVALITKNAITALVERGKSDGEPV